MIDQPTNLKFLATLESVIGERKTSNESDSYTHQLFAAGTQRMAQKVGEEGVEVALAAMSGDRAALRSESADLIYHLLVLLADQNLSLSDVCGELESRHQ